MTRSLRGSSSLRAGLLATVLTISAVVAGPAEAQLFGGRSTPTPPADVGSTETQSPAAAEQSVRLGRAEEQLRQLNGRIDELTFQVQQLHEMVRRMQEGNGLHSQELQGGELPQRRSDSPSADPGIATNGQAAGPGGTSADLQTGFSMDGQPQVGDPPQVLGTVPGDGTAVAAPSESAVGGPLDLSAIARGGVDYPGAPEHGAIGGPAVDADQLPPPGATVPQDSAQVAALDHSGDPNVAYDKAYGHIVAGDYPAAESAFKRFLEEHPGAPQTASALFWLGESFFARERYRDSADAFLTTYRDFPTSSKAPESLLKLGLSLEGLGETDAACATYGELAKKYPDAPPALRARVEQQQQKAGC